MPVIENAEILYLTNALCENAHGNEGYFRQFGLPFSGWDSTTGDLLPLEDGKLPKGTEFYPLSVSEGKYVSGSDIFMSDEGAGLMGYAVLYNGVKYLAPTVEVCYKSDWNDSEDTRDQALEKARRMAVKVQDTLYKIGGQTVIQLDDADDRHTVIALIPFDFVMGKEFKAYNDFLNELFQ